MSRSKQPEKNRKDWHKADVKAALEKHGWNLRRIAREHGYRPESPNTVFWTPWPRVEKIIGEILGIHPAEVWPSRYDRHGNAISSQRRSKLANREAGGNA